MDYEKYGIELELITNKFNEKMQKIKNTFSSLTDNDKQVNLNINTSETDILQRKLRLAQREVERLSGQYDIIEKKVQNQLNFLKQLTARMQTTTGKKIEFIEKDAKYNTLINQLQQTAEKIELASIKADTLKNKLNEAMSPKQAKEIKIVSSSFDGIKQGIERATSQIKKFGYALFSIRSIWSLVGRASSAYLSQDIELANRLQSVWAGLGSLLAPVIEAIVNILAKGVKYINIFIKALTGVDLLARATSKSMAGTAKSAKALNKALAGFDELNNLDTDTGGGADLGAGLGGLENVEINTEWARKIQEFGEWIKANKEAIIGTLLGIAGAILTIKLTSDAFLALGVGITIKGIFDTINGIIDFIKDPSWENFIKILEGITEALIGVGIILGILTGNWIPLIVGLVAYIVVQIVKHWDEIKQTLSVVGQWIYDNIIQPVGDFFQNLWNSIKQTFSSVVQWFSEKFTNAREAIVKAFSSIGQFFKGIWNTVTQIFTGIGQKIGDAVSGAFKTAVNAVLTIMENILNTPIRAINGLISVINAIPRHKFKQIKFV